MKFLITGATGNVGSLVVDALVARSEHPRLFVRDAAKARTRFGDCVELAVGDLEDPPSLEAALDGVDTLFLVSTGMKLASLDAAAVAAAKKTGVRRIVKLSTADAEHGVGTGVWHAQGEAAVRESGLAFTFVRPSGFMVNALAWSHGIKAEGVVRAATGDGQIPFIHSRDIAEVVIAALTDLRHQSAELTITGPQALSYGEMVAQIGSAIGRPLRFIAISDDEARQRWALTGEPPETFDYHLSIFQAIRAGRLAATTQTVRAVLGRPATPFSRWIEENRGAFQ